MSVFCFLLFILLNVAKISSIDGQFVDQISGSTPCKDHSPVCASWATFCNRLEDGSLQRSWCPRTCGRCNDGNDNKSNIGSKVAQFSTKSPEAAFAESTRSAAEVTRKETSETLPDTTSSQHLAVTDVATNQPVTFDPPVTSDLPVTFNRSVTSDPPVTSEKAKTTKRIAKQKSISAHQQQSKSRRSSCNPDQTQVAQLNEDNFEFGVQFYRRCVENSPKENLVFSPFSIARALVSLDPGAKGLSKSEIRRGLAPNVTNVQGGLTALIGRLKQAEESPDSRQSAYRLLIATGVFVDHQLKLKKSFVTETADCYGTTAKSVDFRHLIETVRAEINAWTSSQTDRQIDLVIPVGSITDQTRMILVNAVYLFGEWLVPFSLHGRTYNRLFYPPNNAPGVEVPVMKTTGQFLYRERDDFQVLGMRYKGGQLTMFLILPTNREGLPQLERQLTGAMLTDVVDSADLETVEVTIPKFEIRYNAKLKKNLIDMGISGIFEDGVADLTGINGKDRIWLSDAFHQAYLKVNENGTVSATSSDQENQSSSSKFNANKRIFMAEHSFIYFVRHNPSSTILFFGRVIDPSITP